MDDKQIRFLSREYQQLWKGFGIEFPLWEAWPCAPATESLAEPAPTHAPEDASPHTEPPLAAAPAAACGNPLCQQSPVRVYGQGNSQARLIFIGELGEKEQSAESSLLAGKSGTLLSKMIEAMGLQVNDVYVAGLTQQGDAACLCGLRDQVAASPPVAVVTLGALATKLFTNTDFSDTRGKFQPLFWNAQVPVMPTYQPAYLLRNAGAKKIAWEDLKQVIARLN
ncbi:uracil-DNA glycosylase [bacterium]|nr:uracil-DNA glycosylase [bacterium]